MFSFRRLALLLALGMPAAHLALAQSTSSSSTPPPAQDTPAAEAAPNQGALTVQARIRARREQRRQQAIRDVYSHLYDVNIGMGYLRFTPGTDLQRTTFYSWNVGLTRYYNQRLGATAEARGNYGTEFVGLNESNITRPSISTYMVMGGPSYRFYMQPKYSVSGRVLAGYAHGSFSGDTNGFGGTFLGMYPDGGTFGATAGITGEYNISPGLGLRLTPEYVFTGFGSSVQYSRGFSAGFVFRFGKQ